MASISHIIINIMILNPRGRFTRSLDFLQRKILSQYFKIHEVIFLT